MGEALARLLASTLPKVTDGEDGRACAAEHDQIDYGLLEHAMAKLPALDAARVRDACGRVGRLRFAMMPPLSPPGRRVLIGPRARPL